MPISPDPLYFRFEHWTTTPDTLPEIKTADTEGVLAMIKEALWLAYQQGFKDCAQQIGDGDKTV